ncbi:MAG TPA: sugar ABC transporter substrate-binding protein [Lachnoclostridium phytofermentans]|uniref:Sugar ABC transporter substrate-binding protein n=1 Tax=Lachnoclostridium phytofermentans TaxID=66219 RepID=A0A3D2X1B0_9FIRM|nr:extracellular solute-binding protein [Lachnoclostridium sp.]HCL00939.1 sugar ABC transporter substrate-binding protein [Lachnoclostridium phytofermentans]
MRKGLLKWMTRSMALLMATTVLLGGCGKKGDDTKVDSGNKGSVKSEARYELDPETPAWKLDTKEMTELTWYVNAEWWNTEWGKDIITKKIEEDLHVKINFIVGDDTKLNTLFAGGDMPDLISVFDSGSQAALKASSWALPLFEVADRYDPYFRKVASTETLNWLQLDDGKSYGYADFSNTKADYESGNIFATTAFVIRKDVYEALGSPSMGTQEEFLNVLGQIKEKYPELYPFGFNSFTTDSTGSMGDKFQDFIGVPLLNEDGKYYERNLDEDYLSWIKTFNEAYRKGYISDDSFADDGTAHEEKVKAGKYATIMMDGTPQRSGFLTTWMTSNPDAAYIAIDGPQSTVGNKPTLSQAGISGWMVSYITKQCKDPAKAIQLFTYLLSEEGQILTQYGIEGVSYTINSEGKYEMTKEAKEMQLNENDRFKKEYRTGEFFFFGHDKYKALSDSAFPDSIKQMQEWGKGKLVPHFILENTNPDAGTEEARINTATKTEWTTTLVGLFRANSENEFNSVLDNYKKFLDDNNWASVVEVKNQKIEKNRQKLEN